MDSMEGNLFSSLHCHHGLRNMFCLSLCYCHYYAGRVVSKSTVLQLFLKPEELDLSEYFVGIERNCSRCG